ncbi:hypothetical protein GCM10025787_03040 [Saccharopolyspora rosea]|uniref:DUF222 domain-containing protein n=1 Tax=Saccharopolyspora rosea TaxID=524884 RepID=A0ABW3FS42_9PSEU
MNNHTGRLGRALETLGAWQEAGGVDDADTRLRLANQLIGIAEHEIIDAELAVGHAVRDVNDAEEAADVAWTAELQPAGTPTQHPSAPRAGPHCGSTSCGVQSHGNTSAVTGSPSRFWRCSASDASSKLLKAQQAVVTGPRTSPHLRMVRPAMSHSSLGRPAFYCGIGLNRPMPR